MRIIGEFDLRGNSFVGQIHLIGHSLELVFWPRAKKGEFSPDFDIYQNNYAVGSAWRRKTLDSGKDYLSVKLDDPTLVAPIYARLSDKDERGKYALVWQRPKAKPFATPAE
ncbi:DUF736 domain-containing protein [Brucella pituitosa]